MNQDITFLTDGGDMVRNLAADMSPVPSTFSTGSI